MILLQCPGIRERMITACYRNTIQCDTALQLITGIHRLAPPLSIVVSTFFSADQRYIKNILDAEYETSYPNAKITLALSTVELPTPCDINIIETNANDEPAIVGIHPPSIEDLEVIFDNRQFFNEYLN